MSQADPAPATEPAVSRRCENCGAQLLGDHCYSCGQPTKGLVRHFSSIIGDFFDSVFNFDTRTIRTLGPLLFRPGYLSNEYFHGHRVRYVSPVRLFFFLCILAFFAVRTLVPDDFRFDPEGMRNGALAKADTVAEVEKVRDDTLRELREARENIPDAPGARVGLDVAIRQVEIEARQRLDWIQARDAARARGEEPPPWRSGGLIVEDDDDATSGESAPESPGGRRTVTTSNMQFNDKPWDPVTNPVTVEWLPDAGNAMLNRLIGRASANVERIKTEPRLLVDTFLEALPQTLFVLLPVFALLLKVIYLFKRRLYMEHLIVALHSHAYLCATILLLVAFSLLRDLLGSGVIHALLGWFELALALWMPLYLLLMQKRVYRQGWIMTLLKYCILGTCYFVLIVFGASVNLMISVVAM
jgi:hypothetical protein